MHARELIDLAGSLAFNAEHIIHHAQPPRSTGVEAYWCASKGRLDGWADGIRLFSDNAELPEFNLVTKPDLLILPLLEELFVSDLLTRVWTAIVRRWERNLDQDEASPVVQSVFVGHTEATNRGLKLIAAGKGLQLEQATRLSRLRRQTQRWTDTLIGGLLDESRPELEYLAFDPTRARTFAKEMCRGKRANRDLLRQATQAAFRIAFRAGMSAPAASPDHNRRIASALLECLPDGLPGNIATSYGAPVQERPADITALFSPVEDDQEHDGWWFSLNRVR